MDNFANKRLELNCNEKVHVRGFIGSENISGLQSSQLDFYKQIDGLYDVKSKAHGLSIAIKLNGHGAESVWVNCITRSILNLYSQDVLSYEMKGSGLANYFKTLDAREGSVPLNSFSEVFFKTQNKHDEFFHIELHLKTQYLTDYYHPLYPEMKLINSGDFDIKLDFDIPLLTLS